MMFGKRLLKASGKRLLELPTALELDVFSMRSLWNAWDAHARAVSHWAEVPVRRPRLQFARIKEEAFARWKDEDMHYKDWDIEIGADGKRTALDRRGAGEKLSSEAGSTSPTMSQ
jgi:hypothetical protein